MENETIDNAPLVSTVMSVHNTPEEFLRASIASILSQTYPNFELILVDDASDETTAAILRDYATRPRVKLLVNEKNLRLAGSLNRAIRVAKGKYIARMDSDDVAMPDRFEKQVAFLEKFHDVDVLGSEMLLLKNGSLKPTRKRDNAPWQIQGRIPFGCQGVCHPTVMLRAELFTRDDFYYDESFEVAQDFQLWSRIAMRRKIYVYPEPLLQYRESEFQVSTAKRDKIAFFRSKAILAQLKNFEIEPTEEEKTLHVQLALGKRVASTAALFAWAQKLCDANRRLKNYDPIAFEYYLRRLQFNSALHTTTHAGPTPRNVAATFRALAMYLAAKRAYSRKSKREGNPYQEK